MMTHTEATAKFDRCRDKEKGYHLAKNTKLQKRGKAFAVRYQNTDVVMIRPDNTYRLNSGGWRTKTTKDRINSFSPCSISQTNGMWYAKNTPYRDRMLVDSAGNLIGTPKHTIAEVAKMKRRVDRLFTKFLKLVAESARNRDIGDWYSYRSKFIPKPNSKSHLAKLWHTVLVETSNKNEWAGGPHLFIWIYLSNARGRSQFGYIRNNCMVGPDDSMLLHTLRTFVRQRKQHITEMILSGELSDGTMRIS